MGMFLGLGQHLGLWIWGGGGGDKLRGIWGSRGCKSALSIGIYVGATS